MAEGDRGSRWWWSFVVALLTLLVTTAVGWDELKERFSNVDDGLAAVETEASSTTSSSMPSTAFSSSATTTHSVEPTQEVVALTALGAEDLADLSSDLLVAFEFIHSGLCLSSDSEAITQEMCEAEPPTASSQLWLLGFETDSTTLRQADRCLLVTHHSDEVDPMGNTIGHLGMGSCEEASVWRLSYVTNRDAFRIVSLDQSRCLDVLGGKDWTGQPVVSYPCLDFENQMVTVQRADLDASSAEATG